MPYLVYQQSYDERVLWARAVLAAHQPRPTWFGLGPDKCRECGESWGRVGCLTHVRYLRMYLQVSNEQVRAEDTRHRRYLFSETEAHAIVRLDSPPPDEAKPVSGSAAGIAVVAG